MLRLFFFRPDQARPPPVVVVMVFGIERMGLRISVMIRMLTLMVILMSL